ncbi:MAG: hypothetical protein LBW85_10400 [Deltaproteobacteria bacterium]|nr:hypothetical protein [Deltaproteobacteria bacterium]
MIQRKLQFALAAALFAAAAAFCLAPSAATAQEAPSAQAMAEQFLANQPPLTAEEVQQYVDFMKSAASGTPGTPPGGGDNIRGTYIATKIGAAVLLLTNPAATKELIESTYGTPLANPTDEELELVKARLSDLVPSTAPAAPPAAE